MSLSLERIIWIKSEDQRWFKHLYPSGHLKYGGVWYERFDKPYVFERDSDFLIEFKGVLSTRDNADKVITIHFIDPCKKWVPYPPPLGVGMEKYSIAFGCTDYRGNYSLFYLNNLSAHCGGTYMFVATAFGTSVYSSYKYLSVKMREWVSPPIGVLSEVPEVVVAPVLLVPEPVAVQPTRSLLEFKSFSYSPPVVKPMESTKGLSSEYYKRLFGYR